MKNCIAYYGGGAASVSINELDEVEFAPADERNRPDQLAAATLQGLWDEYDDSNADGGEGKPLSRWDEVVQWLDGVAEGVKADESDADESRVY